MKLLLLQFNNFKFYKELNIYSVYDRNDKLLYQCNDLYDSIDYVSNLNSIALLKLFKFRLIKFLNSNFFKFISPLIKKNLFIYNQIKKIYYYINK